MRYSNFQIKRGEGLGWIRYIQTQVGCLYCVYSTQPQEKLNPPVTVMKRAAFPENSCTSKHTDNQQRTVGGTQIVAKRAQCHCNLLQVDRLWAGGQPWNSLLGEENEGREDGRLQSQRDSCICKVMASIGRGRLVSAGLFARICEERLAVPPNPTAKDFGGGG